MIGGGSAAFDAAVAAPEARIARKWRVIPELAFVSSIRGAKIFHNDPSFAGQKTRNGVWGVAV
jgi:hypothetical protein